MSNRTAKLVSAIFASLLAGAPFATVSHGAAAECLSGPKDPTPEGSHWYYRIEHPSERHCWYLRKEGEKLSQVASPAAPPAAKQVSPDPAPAIQRSIADAHAELPQSENATIWQRRHTGHDALANIPRADADALRTPASSAPRLGNRVALARAGGHATLPVSPQPAAASPAASCRQYGCKRTIETIGGSAPCRRRGPPRRGGLVIQKPVRLDPDAADHRDGRAVAGRGHGRRHLQVRQQAM